MMATKRGLFVQLQARTKRGNPVKAIVFRMASKVPKEENDLGSSCMIRDS